MTNEEKCDNIEKVSSVIWYTSIIALFTDLFDEA